METAYLFQGISPRSHAEVARIAVAESYPKGAFLFHAGDPARHLYLLEEGRVRVSIEGTGRLAHIVSEPGEALGWPSMVDNEVYTASAECLVPVRVIKMEEQALERVLEADPASGLAFYKRLAKLISRRLVASQGATLSVHGPRDPRSYG